MPSSCSKCGIRLKTRDYYLFVTLFKERATIICSSLYLKTASLQPMIDNLFVNRRPSAARQAPFRPVMSPTNAAVLPVSTPAFPTMRKFARPNSLQNSGERLLPAPLRPALEKNPPLFRSVFIPPQTLHSLQSQRIPARNAPFDREPDTPTRKMFKKRLRGRGPPPRNATDRRRTSPNKARRSRLSPNPAEIPNTLTDEPATPAPPSRLRS